MKELTNLCLRALALLVAATAVVFAQEASPAVSLFDGKTLEGWDYTEGVWRVEDGAITAGSHDKDVPKNEFISTKKSYANFELKLKIKCSGDLATGQVNSGIQIRSARLPGGVVAGYQVDCGKGWFGKIYDEHRRRLIYPTPIDEPTLLKGVDTFGWNEYRILAEGPRIQVWINGIPASDYTETNPFIPLNGVIAPQIHKGGHAMVQFKDVTIRELPPTPAAPTWESLGGAEAALEKVETSAQPKARKGKAEGAPATPGETPRAKRIRERRNQPSAPAPAAPQPKAAPKAGARTIKEGNALEAKARTPEEQLRLFKLPEGFTIELVASEATGVPKPVSLAFDDAGRLWTQTATEYPRDMDPGVWSKPGKDRVVVIDHPEKAGPQPVRTFADGMVMPMGVLPYGDGAFVAQGPEILFLADMDGDGKADTRKALIKGFGVQDTHTLPHQLVRLAGGKIGFSQGVLNSGTLFDADGKMYPFNKTLIASFAPQGNGLRVIAAGMNNIWAWAQDRLGRVFIHEANDWGHSLTPFEEDSSYVCFIGTSIHPDVPMHPPTAEGLNLGGTGFSGIAVSDDRSGSFQGTWRDAFFVANPIIGKINHATGKQGADGVWAFQRGEDLVSCADPMFRPVFITFGPDGCLYIADWYNRIISHNEVARDHPGRDKDHGRIWRVRQTGQPRRTITDYTTVPTDQLPAALKSDSTWAMRAAWHQMAQRQDKSVVPALVAMLRDSQTPVDVKIAALWTREEIAPFDADLWKHLFGDASSDLRREAVRALITLKVPQAVAGPLLKQQLSGETAWTVRYQVLRYFRLADGPVATDDLAWLKGWSATPAKTTKVKGQKGAGGADGEYLALDGSYQRAFQDFLFMLAETKTHLPVMTPAKYDGVIAKHPAPADPATVAARIAAVKTVLPKAKAEDGRALTEGLCLNCHSLGGKGVGFAPPLDGTWSRDVDGVLTAIVDPSAAMENVFRNFRVVRTDGTIIEGFKQNENRHGVMLLLMGGVPQSIPMKAIKSAGYIEGQSMMPYITGGMTPEQVASIVAYLRSVK